MLRALADIEHPQLSYVAACRDPKGLPAGYNGEIRVGDLRDADYLDRMLAGIDIVCHCAGWTSFLNHPQLSVKHYLEPSVELFNRALEWRVSRFVNLSSIAVAPRDQRHTDDSDAKPRRGQAMLNCMIGFEDYLKAHAGHTCSVINLRAGVYSGRGLRRGLVPVLERIGLPFHGIGANAHLPLVDGRDLAQGFLRAALSTQTSAYNSFNIVGSEQPKQSEFFHYLSRFSDYRQPAWGLPAMLGRPLRWMNRYITSAGASLTMTDTLDGLLCNPIIDITKAQQQLGYDPQVSWQASINDWLQHPLPPLSDEQLMQAEWKPLYGEG